MDAEAKTIILMLVQTLERCKTYFNHPHVINRQTSELMTLEIQDAIKDAQKHVRDA